MFLKKISNSPTIMSWASNFVRFGSMIFVLPQILIKYSDLEQSLWFITSTIIGFAMMADSGFGSVLVRAVSYFKAGATSIPRTKEDFDKAPEFEDREPNRNGMRDLLTTTNVIYLFLGVLVVILLLTGGLGMVWNIIRLSNNRYDFWLAFFLLIPYCVITINTVKWDSFMKGLNYVALSARFKAITSSIRIAVFAIILTFNAKPAVLIAIMVLEAFVINWYMRKRVMMWFENNQVLVKKTLTFNKDIFWSIWPATWKLGGLFWGSFLIGHGNSILMAQIADTKLMAAFLFTNRIIGFLKTVSLSPFYANIPSIYQFAAQKKLNELRSKSSQMIFLGVALFIAGSLIIIFAGNWVMELMHSQTRFIDTGLLILLLVTILLDIHATFHASIYTSTNHIPFLIPALVSGAVVIGVGFLALPVYGLLGILMVRFLAELAFNNWYTVYLSIKLLQWPFGRYLIDMPSSGFKFIKAKLAYFVPKLR